jgi:long-chain acyl-CoA synthetase
MALAGMYVEAERRGEVALADERVTLSWNDLDGYLNRATNALLSFRPPVGRVSICALNSVEVVVAYTAALQAGVSSTPTSYHFKALEAAHILSDSGSGILFVGPETVDVGLEAARLARCKTVIGWRCDPRPGLIHWEQWVSQADDQAPPTDLKPAPHLHYTSGTTGKPKAVETPPTQLPRTSTIAELVEWLHGRRLPSPGLVVGPNYHTGPLTTIRGLLAGSAVVVLESFDAEKVLSAIERYSVASAVMVPTHFQRLLALPPATRARYDVSSLQRLSHTGAACPANVKRQMIEWFGPVLYEAYGGTEIGATNVIDSHEWLRKPGSVGKAVPPYEIVIVDARGAELGPNETGQIYFRDATRRGIVYFNDARKTEEANIAPGVCTLGDVGYVDSEGYLFITDRVADMVVSGGVNIYPAEAEQVLLKHPKVADVAIIGVPNVEMGEEVKALVVPSDPQAPPSQEELDLFCRAALAGYKCPRSYEMVADLGRTVMDKLDKRKLRQRYWPTDRTIGG